MKVNIKNLPDGYKIVNGKVIKSLQKGGSPTTNNTLQPIPRDIANLEAEKGETTLTDLDGDGVFELYNIGGKRHSAKGTPLNLPPQSFVFSDTRAMMFTVKELATLGIDSKKKMTPADASKKFQLNKYTEAAANEFADVISTRSAESMIDKNKIKLSQIAFMQESKKDFEDGVPLAAYPFLVSKGINPEEFVAKVEQVNAERDKVNNVAQMPQGGPTHTMPDGTVHPGATHEEYMAMSQRAPQQMGRYGTELPKAQKGLGLIKKFIKAASTGSKGSKLNPWSNFKPYMVADPKIEIFAEYMNAHGIDWNDPKALEQFGEYAVKNKDIRLAKNTEELESIWDYHTGATTGFGHQEIPTPWEKWYRDKEFPSSYKRGGGIKSKKACYDCGGPIMRDGGDGDPFSDNPLNQFVYGNDIPMAQRGVETNDLTDIQQLVYVQQLLQTQYQQMLQTVKANPEILENIEDRMAFDQNLSQLKRDMEMVNVQLGELQQSQILENQRLKLSPEMEQMIGSPPEATQTDSTGYDMTKGLDAVWNASDLSRFIAQDENVNQPYQYGGSLPKFEEGGPSRVCTTGPNGEITCPGDSHQYHDSVIEGDAAHQQFEDMLNQNEFSGIKDKWIEAYKKNACKSFEGGDSKYYWAGIDPDSCGGTEGIKFATGYDEDKLWNNFMNVNRQLQGFKSIGYGTDKEYGDFGSGGNEYGAIADKYGMTKFDESQIRGWQGMFASLRELKNAEGQSPSEEQFFANLSTTLEGEGWGTDSIHEDSAGGYMSAVDGLLGKTSAGQYVGIQNEPIVKEGCSEAEQQAWVQKCLREKKDYVHPCSCGPKVPVPVPGKIPAYETFPQDDLNLMGKIDNRLSRNMRFPAMGQVDPIMRDPMYLDPTQDIATIGSMANTAMAANPDQAAFIQAVASEKANEAIAKTHNQNIKIYDNVEGYNVDAVNKAQRDNQTYFTDYVVDVNNVLKEAENTEISDNEAIRKAQIDRMTHADKLYELNMQTPQYWYSPQKHSMQFYNYKDFLASKDKGSSNVTWEQAQEACIKAGFTAGEKGKLIECINSRMKANTSAPSTNTASYEDVVATDDIPSSRYGGQINRKNELINSRMALSKWLRGIK